LPEKEKMCLAVFSGELDKALAAFFLATTAASMGWEVSMFFTFWGLNIIKKNEGPIKSKGLMNKMFNIIKTVFKIALEDIKSGKTNNFNTIEDLRNNNWKFRDYCHRSIIKNRLYGDKGYAYVHLVWALEKLTTRCYFLMKDFQNSKTIKNTDESIKIVEMLIDYIIFYEKNMFKLDEKNFDEIRERSHRIREFGLKLLKDKRHDQHIALRIIMCNADLIASNSWLMMINS